MLHYGIPASKTKAVAKMRLFDAIQSGNLAVPGDIAKIEADLMKQWKKKDRLARAGKLVEGDGSAGGANAAGQIANKRKREDTVTDSGKKKRSKEEKQAKTKTARSSTGGGTAGDKKSDRSKEVKTSSSTPQARNPASLPGEATIRGTESGRLIEAVSTPTEGRPPRTKRTVRRSRPFLFGARQSDRPETPTEPQVAGPTEGPPRRTKQTARCPRGGAFAGGRRWTSVYTEEHPQHGLPPLNGLDPTSIQSEEADLWQPSESTSPLGRLGLINGEYEIRAPYLEEGWPDFVADDGFSLTLVLNQSKVWGAHDFGIFTGIMNIQRPQRASYLQLPFEWRGREMNEGQMSFGPRNQGWIQFLGDDRIEGVINCDSWTRFSGRRISGQDARAPRKPADMQDEWNQYNQFNYDRECVDRWR